MNRSGIHVIRDDDRWWVLREGEDGVPSSAYPSLRDAVRTARDLAQREGSEVTLYDELGRVRAWYDFQSEREA